MKTARPCGEERLVSKGWKTPAGIVPRFGILILTLTLSWAGLATARTTLVRPDPAALLDQVRAALPTVPLRVEGELQARDRRGNITRIAPVELDLNWGAPVPQAVYTVFDRFGSVQERMTVEWPEPGLARWSLERGDPPELVPDPDWAATVAGFDLTWADLSLSFLWWAGGRWVGSERIRGRLCEIIELTAPEDAATAYAGVRLWIDPETALLLQADALDRRGRAVRRVQVRSLRKIDEMWMVQNLDIYNHATRERVTLRVRDLDVL